MNDLMTAVRAAAEGIEPLDRATSDALLRQTDARSAAQAGRALASRHHGDMAEPRITVTANCTVGSYADILRSKLAGIGLEPSIDVAPYGEFEASLALGQLASADSGFVICLIDESCVLPRDWGPAEGDALFDRIEQRTAIMCEQMMAASASSSATFILHTVPLPDEVRDSFLSWRARTELSRRWCLLNAAILALAARSERIIVIDLAGLLSSSASVPRDDRLFHFGHLSFSDDALLLHADHVRRYLQAHLGLSRKGLALDLDNTLWGGVVGEVGPGQIELGGLYPGSAYAALQLAARRLRSQGIVLAITSKNDDTLVDEVLRDHPEMLLRKEDFSAVAVNWTPKPRNLADICESLGLAASAFVFMDDSRFERGEMAAQQPEITLVSAEGDPALHVRELLRWGWFDVVDLTDTDRRRPDLYRKRNDRAQFSSGFGDRGDYLRALGLCLDARPANRFSISRVAQLAARTNQFNLTGIRYSAAETASMADDPACFVYAFSVSDQFGDEGIVGAAWGERQANVWRITNLVLSCRVLGRGIEEAIVAWIAARAEENGAASLEGHFVPSGRNGVAGDLWQRCGFSEIADGTYTLHLSTKSIEVPAWVRIASENEVAA